MTRSLLNLEKRTSHSDGKWTPQQQLKGLILEGNRHLNICVLNNGKSKFWGRLSTLELIKETKISLSLHHSFPPSLPPPRPLSL